MTYRAYSAYRAPSKTAVGPSDTAEAQVSGGRLQQGLDIAERESPASVTRRVTGNRGRVVGNDHLGVADLAERSHRRQHVHLAFVDERLCVVVARFLRAHVAKVNVVDAVFAAEVADDLYNILADLRGYAGQRRAERVAAGVEVRGIGRASCRERV